MILFYGIRKVRIKKYDDFHIKCENCNDYGQEISVYQKYFHVFFIPIFPFGTKTIRSLCLKCNDTFNDKKINHYLSITKTPVYLYTGIILLLTLITTMVVANINAQKQKAEYVANPQTNDVYLIRQDDEKSTIYYFFKVKNVNIDSVVLLHSYLQYDHFVSAMNDSDYFVRDDTFMILKSDLKKYLDSGMINAVERGYDKSNRFAIER
ncbi:zinc-ribbon domain-containing protein [Parabacteroides sp. 52]|uniref:zinc-ribbon domain-containing protein n=1 Tax=unclassified Parabacteroides TaxID=2649774 RepID=UPI0013CFA093|nr:MULTISPECIES: zinc-ribbon domain-containing protein [unclassified Parabacteroides]MDH6533991.1 hypothetical protein [Parabacteroides sp. PM5-20]NDV54732.1 zinc-ribbon domain-containing protein [Parabacteroides sp. 52]